MNSSENNASGALDELFIEQLQDILWAEKALVQSLEKMAQTANNEELQRAFQEHKSQTSEHITRLEEVFESIGEEVADKKCKAMAGLIAEAEELIRDTQADPTVCDAALIAAAQKVEHYEIASYGTLKTLAAQLGYMEAHDILMQTLDEEKETDALLTEIAEGSVNEDAD